MSTGMSWWLTLFVFACGCSSVASTITRATTVVTTAADRGGRTRTRVSYGHDMLAYFDFDPALINVNFGSYGAPPRMVSQNQSAYRAIMDASPDSWFRFNVTPLLNAVQQQLAAYLGIDDWMDLVFILNASHGVNSILQSIANFIYNTNTNGDTNKKVEKRKFLYFNTAYGMVRNTLHYLETVYANDDMLVEFNVTTQMFNNQTLLVSALDSFLMENNRAAEIYVASISQIVSVPAVIFDVQRIQAVFRKHGILTLIDAAHVIGQLPVRLSADLDPDFWLSNGHKWLFSPRGSAVLYVKKEHQAMVYPTCISNEGHGQTPFQLHFNLQGTNDHTPWLAMAAALDFRDTVGGGDQQIMDYNQQLCRVATSYFMDLWGTFPLVYNESYVGSMIDMPMPMDATQAECQLIQTELYNNGQANPARGGNFSYVVMYPWEGRMYTRISCQIFNELSDYQWVAAQVLSILQRLRGGGLG